MSSNAREFIHHSWVIDDDGVLQVSELNTESSNPRKCKNFKCVGLVAAVKLENDPGVVDPSDPLPVTRPVLVYQVVDTLGQKRCLHLQKSLLHLQSVATAARSTFVQSVVERNRTNSSGCSTAMFMGTQFPFDSFSVQTNISAFATLCICPLAVNSFVLCFS